MEDFAVEVCGALGGKGDDEELLAFEGCDEGFFVGVAVIDPAGRKGGGGGNER